MSPKVLDELSCKWEQLLIGNDDTDAVVELNVEMPSGKLGEIDLNVADIVDGPRLGVL